jgi:hypothetical protein
MIGACHKPRYESICSLERSRMACYISNQTLNNNSGGGISMHGLVSAKSASGERLKVVSSNGGQGVRLRGDLPHDEQETNTSFIPAVDRL